MHLKLTAADKTDVGKQREQNEDAPYKRIESSPDGDLGLFIVADGMGGYQAGEVASRLAVETISRAMDSFFQPVQDQPTLKLAPLSEAETIKIQAQTGDDKTTHPRDDKAQQTRRLPETPITRALEDQLKAAIEQANHSIVRYGEQKTAARGLGCTVTTVLVQNDKAYIANVGDSRTYLLRAGVLKPLTKDHSLVAKLVEAKQIEPDDVYSHPQRNLIYRSLGAGHKNVEVDVFQADLRPGDTLLLCSDGLWEMVRQQDLLKVLSEGTGPQKICTTLIDLANANGGEDNITAVVVQISAH